MKKSLSASLIVMLAIIIGYCVLNKGGIGMSFRTPEISQPIIAKELLLPFVLHTQSPIIATSPQDVIQTCTPHCGAKTNSDIQAATPSGIEIRKSNKQQDEEMLNIQTTKAAAEFKKSIWNRREAARTLCPLLKRGLSRSEVAALLGPPTENLEDGKLWVYVLFYEAILAVHFDSDGNVLMVN